MLRSVRELEKLRAVTDEGTHCGRIKDLYFDDRNWEIQQFILSIEPRQFRQQQILLKSEHLSEICPEEGLLKLNLTPSDIATLPLASSVRPVCRQYASLAFGSLAARRPADQLHAADPHLRSARAVMAYQIDAPADLPTQLKDLLFDDQSWAIRFLLVEQKFEGRILRFHILPQSVERFTWSTQRVVLRNLQPVHQSSGPQTPDLLSAA